MENIEYREMTEEYLPEVLDIYNYYVLYTTATFHTAPLTLAEMREILFFDNQKFKTFVILSGGIVCGYAIAAQFKKREAYDSTAESTVYLKPEYTGKGIGDQAVKYIEEYALTQDFHVLIALICGENTQSIKVSKKTAMKNARITKKSVKSSGSGLMLWFIKR